MMFSQATEAESSLKTSTVGLFLDLYLGHSD